MRTCAGAFRNIISVAFFSFCSFTSLFQYGLLQPTHTSILISTPEREENIENCNPSQSIKWHVSAFFSCRTIYCRQEKRKKRERDTNRVRYILSLIQLAVAIDENQWQTGANKKRKSIEKSNTTKRKKKEHSKLKRYHHIGPASRWRKGQLTN